jgi:hypothetical protein
MKKDHEEEHGINLFYPEQGDVMLELKGNANSKRYGRTFIWRIVATSDKIKKVWPNEEKNSCPHDDVLWAIDSKVRLISLCEECGEFAFGQKTEE